MKLWLAFGFAFGLSVASAEPLDDLMPRPRACVAEVGVADAAACANPVVKTGTVDGAPERFAKESYRLEVRTDCVTIVAPDAHGVRYARTTLEQLVRLSDGKVPCDKLMVSFVWEGD